MLYQLIPIAIGTESESLLFCLKKRQYFAPPFFKSVAKIQPSAVNKNIVEIIYLISTPSATKRNSCLVVVMASISFWLLPASAAI